MKYIYIYNIYIYNIYIYKYIYIYIYSQKTVCRFYLFRFLDYQMKNYYEV